MIPLLKIQSTLQPCLPNWIAKLIMRKTIPKIQKVSSVRHETPAVHSRVIKPDKVLYKVVQRVATEDRFHKIL